MYQVIYHVSLYNGIKGENGPISPRATVRRFFQLTITTETDMLNHDYRAIWAIFPFLYNVE